ncbi:hypothetical protein BV898_05166 [Hypsibius exemplaris]|uniref:Uncharacterized protein n=1 Tax=Hypsibius exemplaris TaxID=2072580 RepID=A0A1W0X071_HYPEX|nr:hypothetical protein BV898_05166 [Hypsibius exemplaris]
MSLLLAILFSVVVNLVSTAPIDVVVLPKNFTTNATTTAAVIQAGPMGRSDSDGSLSDALGLMSSVLAPRFMQPGMGGVPAASPSPAVAPVIQQQQQPVFLQPQQQAAFSPQQQPQFIPAQQQQPAAFFPQQQGQPLMDARSMPLGGGGVVGQTLYPAGFNNGAPLYPQMRAADQGFLPQQGSGVMQRNQQQFGQQSPNYLG